MARPKLTNEQREQLLEWLAADYSTELILRWIAKGRRRPSTGPEESKADEQLDTVDWSGVTRQTISYYRQQYEPEITAAREQRRTAAIDRGLALKAERVQRLVEHADELEAIKWLPDNKGRLWNEKAWRETLDDIAKEMGHRRQGVDLAMQQEIEGILSDLRERLSPEEYAKVAAIIMAGGGSKTA